MPTPKTARLASALTVKNLESMEMKAITKQAAAMAARTIRSPLETIISLRALRALASAGGRSPDHLCAEAS